MGEDERLSESGCVMKIGCVCLAVQCGGEEAGGRVGGELAQLPVRTCWRQECGRSAGRRRPEVSLACCAMEVMDSSMAVTEGADRGAHHSHARMDGDSIADEAVPHGRGSLNLTLSAQEAVFDECLHDREDAAGEADGVSPEDSAALADVRCRGPDDGDLADARVDCHASGSGDGCSGETPCLEACMTRSGQEYYLRRGGTPRRRSALRLSRIIARQQLLRRLSQGRNLGAIG